MTKFPETIGQVIDQRVGALEVDRAFSGSGPRGFTNDVYVARGCLAKVTSSALESRLAWTQIGVFPALTLSPNRVYSVATQFDATGLSTTNSFQVRVRTKGTAGYTTVATHTIATATSTVLRTVAARMMFQPASTDSLVVVSVDVANGVDVSQGTLWLIDEGRL